MVFDHGRGACTLLRVRKERHFGERCDPGSAASSTEAESLYKEGAGYVGEEDYESAIESLLKCIELDPNYSKAYIQLSKAYIGNEEYDEAEAILKQGYEKTKDPSLEKEQENCIRSICQVLTDNEDYETADPWLLSFRRSTGLPWRTPYSSQKRTP